MTITTTPGPLLEATRRFPTALWNDSADPDELQQSIACGAVGATCNPSIAYTCITQAKDRWLPRIAELAEERPEASESEIGWQIVRELSVDAAKQLEPIFDEHKGRNGRLSMQTDTWQQRINASDYDPVERIDVPVDQAIMDELQRIPEFVRAYEPDGMTPEEFDSFGATLRTMRGFLAADNDLDVLVRDVLYPAP